MVEIVTNKEINASSMQKEWIVLEGTAVKMWSWVMVMSVVK